MGRPSLASLRRHPFATTLVLSLAAHVLLALVLFVRPLHRYGATLTTITIDGAPGAPGMAHDAQTARSAVAVAQPTPRPRHARRLARITPPSVSPTPATPTAIDPPAAPATAADTTDDSDTDGDSDSDDNGGGDESPLAGANAGVAEVGDGSLDSGGERIGHPASLVPGSCTDTLDYPDGAMRSRHEGVVRMIISLDERGHVLQAKVTARAGFGLDETALEAVKTRCRFNPARDNDGRAVSTLVEHLFAFHIARIYASP